MKTAKTDRGELNALWIVWVATFILLMLHVNLPSENRSIRAEWERYRQYTQTLPVMIFRHYGPIEKDCRNTVCNSEGVRDEHHRDPVLPQGFKCSRPEHIMGAYITGRREATPEGFFNWLGSTK